MQSVMTLAVSSLGDCGHRRHNKWALPSINPWWGHAHLLLVAPFTELFLLVGPLPCDGAQQQHCMIIRTSLSGQLDSCIQLCVRPLGPVPFL